MNQIRNYVEAMFSGLPKNKEVIEMKLNITENMEEKFKELIDEGKNENEAIGIVISQFGSIDELKKELGIDDSEAEKNNSDTASNNIFNEDSHEIQKLKEEYLNLKNKIPLYYAIAVGLYILSPLTIVFTAEILEKEHLWPLIPFFLFIALATGIFIYFGIKEDHYEKILGIGKKEEDDNPFSGFIFIAATVIYLILGFTKNLWHPGWIIFIAAAAINVLLDYFYRKK